MTDSEYRIAVSGFPAKPPLPGWEGIIRLREGSKATNCQSAASRRRGWRRGIDFGKNEEYFITENSLIMQSGNGAWHIPEPTRLS